tara:strand:- start:18 stop:755 length:738 start_codon:yes stop_codon:yes gene_type:complete
VGTVSHPSNNALQASDITVDTTTLVTDSTNNRVGIGTASPSTNLHVSGGVMLDGVTVIGRNQTSYASDGAEVLIDANASTPPLICQVGGSTTFSIDANGHVTKPLQSAFMATLSGDQTNIAENSNVDVQFATERFDQNSDYDTSNYTFTAPVTGRYHLSVILRMASLSNGAAYYYLELTTSNDLYYNIFDPDFGQDALFWTATLSLLVDMDANDTATVHIFQEGSGTGSQTDINNDSFFSGYLVC